MTIHLEYRHLFPVCSETYWRELCLSLDYQERLYREALGCTKMEVLEHQGDYERGMQRRLRFTKGIDAPAAITKLFGSAVTVEEQSEFDANQQRWSYRIVPAIMGDRIDIRGTVQIAPHADGVEQRSTNTIACRVFGIGSIIEHFVGKSTGQGTSDKFAFTERYIRENSLR